MYRWMAAIGAAGTLAALLYGGVPSGTGFLVGTGFSVLNFWFWHRLVKRVGQVSAPEEQPRKASTVLFGLRYLLFGAGAYVILHYFEASLFAALAGCFVAVAAVIFEIVVELIHGT